MPPKAAAPPAKFGGRFPCNLRCVLKSSQEIRLQVTLPSVCLTGTLSAVVRAFVYREARISRPNTRSLRNKTTLFSYTSSPSSNPFSARNS